MVLADNAFSCQVRTAKQHSSGNKAASKCIDKASSRKSDPVKVVCAPEALEDDALFDDALLLCGVETCSV